MLVRVARQLAVFIPAFACTTLLPSRASAQRPSERATPPALLNPAYDSSLYFNPAATSSRFKALQWRLVGPFRGGRSVAVVGASRRRGQLGAELLHNLRTTGFRGALYAVNPNVTELEGVRSFPTLAAIPEPIDLAIISVPAALVHGVVGADTGTVNQNVLPAPSVLSAQMRPPCPCTIALEM